MTTQMVKLCYRNILETGNVSVTDQNNSYPSYRLYDRDIGKLFKGNSAGNNNQFSIIIDQGANNAIEIDRLIIPAGHSLNGLALELYHSNDGNNWTGAANNWNATSGTVDVSFNATTKQYWDLVINTNNSVPELSEMFLTKTYTFERNPNYGLEDGKKKNVLSDETQSGLVRLVKFGEPRRFRSYQLTKIGDNQKTNLESWDDHCEGIKALYLIDHQNGAFFAWLTTKDLIFAMEHENRWSVRMEFLEVL